MGMTGPCALRCELGNETPLSVLRVGCMCVPAGWGAVQQRSSL